jgi:hypothetical protein
MKEQKVILGEFEDKLYAEEARRELKAGGINANILKNDTDAFVLFSNEPKGVQLVIPGNEVEKAKKILETKFI